MLYSLKIMRSAFKELRALNKQDRQRVIAAIDQMAENPHVGKLLKGDLSGLRRNGVEHFRVIYKIDQGRVLFSSCALPFGKRFIGDNVSFTKFLVQALIRT